MTALAGRTYWIVGASEGLGRALALRFARAGAEVVLSARNGARLEALAAGLAGEPGGARAVAVDVTDRTSVAAAVLAAGPVDGIVYCAGRYEPMTAGAWDADEAEAICDVNFMGAMRVLGRVVPAMIRQGRGHVLLVGSLAAHRGLPGAIGYGASKAALMSLAESLLADTRGSGVKVQIANPGFIRTRLTAKNAFRMPAMMSAEEAAEHIFRFSLGPRFRTDFPAPFALLFTLGRLVPIRLFHRVFRGSGTPAG